MKNKAKKANAKKARKKKAIISLIVLNQKTSCYFSDLYIDNC